MKIITIQSAITRNLEAIKEREEFYTEKYGVKVIILNPDMVASSLKILYISDKDKSE